MLPSLNDLIWIITESDRTVTTLLLLEEYEVELFSIHHKADSDLRLTSSSSRIWISGGEQWRYGWRRAAVLGRLFVTVANLYQ